MWEDPRANTRKVTSSSSKSFLSRDAYEQTAAVWEPPRRHCHLSSVSLLRTRTAPLPACVQLRALASYRQDDYVALCKHLRVCSAGAGAGWTRSSPGRPAPGAERGAAAGARDRLGHSTPRRWPCSEHGAGRPSAADRKDVPLDGGESHRIIES